MRNLIQALCLPLLALTILFFGSCGSSDNPPTYTVGGTVSGLTGTGLVLQLNGGNDLTVDADGAFTFPPQLFSGTTYIVTAKSVPVGNICSISNAGGTITAANVTNVGVTCSLNGYSVGGTVTGLDAGEVVLQLNGADDLIVTQSGSFIFPVLVADGSTYAVTVATPPAQGTCTISNGSGTIAGANVTDVLVSCTVTFTVGGTVAGLPEPPPGGIDLVLQLNGGDDLTITENGTFAFPGMLANGASYAVTILSTPPGFVCELRDGEGIIMSANVTGVEVLCAGQVSGLAGTTDTAPSTYHDVETDGTTTAITEAIPNTVNGLAYVQEDQLLYGAAVESSGPNSLLQINPFLGTYSTVGAAGAIGFDEVEGLAFDPVNEVLYGIAENPNPNLCQLITIDRTTGVGSPVGTGADVGNTSCTGLAYHLEDEVLYASTADGGMLFTIDPATGASTASIWLHTNDPLEGLGYDRDSNRLFVLRDATFLDLLNPATGVLAPLGNMEGFSGMSGLAYASDMDDLLGTDIAHAGTTTLLTMEEFSGPRIRTYTIGSTGYRFAGMARNPVTGRAYGITADSHLVEMNPNTGETHHIAKAVIPNGWETRSLAYNRQNQRLYTFAVGPVSTDLDLLVELNLFGATTGVTGPVHLVNGHFEGLTIDPGGAIFGVFDPGSGTDCELYQVTTGSLVMLVQTLTGFDGIRSITFDETSTPSSQRFYAVDSATSQLVEIDISAGTQTATGPTEDMHGLIWIE